MSSLVARWWRRLWLLARPSLWVLVATAAVIAALGTAANWMLRHEAGTAWLLARIPRLHIEGLQGALLSERWQIERLRVDVGGGLRAVIIDGIDAQGLRWGWDTSQPRWLSLQMARITARSVVLELGQGDGKPAQVPKQIRLPLAIAARQLEVGELRIGNLPAWRQITAVAGVEHGEEAYRLDDLAFEWDRLRFRGQARLGSVKPLQLTVQGRVRTGEGAEDTPEWVHDWSGDLTIDGPLERFDARATLHGQVPERGGPGREPPMLEASVTVTPFAPWALASLGARTQGLDLAALSSAWPRTRLSGEVKITSHAADQPFGADVRLDNAAPGRFDEGRLPLRRIELAAQASLQQRDQLELKSFDLQFASGQADAGRWNGRGQWRGTALSLDTNLRELRPHLIDDRAPRLQASGPLTLQVGGVRFPGSAPPLPKPTDTKGKPATTEELSVEAKASLEGRVEGAAQPVALTLDGRYAASQLELRTLRATAGSASAEAQALLAARGGGWTLKTSGTLADFDPRQWWPGAEGSAWRQGPHRFNGRWQFDLTSPTLPARQSAQATDWLPWLQRLSGNGQLTLRESQLAGVPLALELTLAQPAADGAGRATLDAELLLGGNRLKLEGQGQPAGDGSGDRWRAELSAEALAALAPLARLSPDLAPWAPRDGRAVLSAQGEGRWPDVKVAGQLALEKVRLGELALEKAQARWQVDTTRDQPLDALLELQGLRQARQSLDRARLALQGTLREHRIQLDAALPLRPPAWLESVLGLAGSDGTRALAEGDGQWLPDGSGGGTWRGRLARLRAAHWNSTRPAAAGDAANGATWLDAADLRAELLFSAEGGITEVRAEPARVRLADAVTLRWDAVRIDLRGERADYALRAAIEPFDAAPVLARAQPGVGWGGDLKLAATVDLQATPRSFDADIVFERRGGDLFVEDSLGRQALGLDALRLALAVHDGVWRFTPRVSGRTLGEIGGELSLRARREQRWPDAQAALEGAVEARVANLGIWTTWVPPGWRLVGTLATRATLGGRLGAPEYTGTLAGNGIGVRNLLLGVDVSGGDVLVSLKGDRAVIERFQVRGGDGVLTLAGGAEFGESPVAKVRLEGQRFRVLGRVDRRLVASGSAALELRADRVDLDGQVSIDEGLFDVSRRDAPALDDDVVQRGAAFTTGSGTPNASDASAEGPARGLRRNSRVALKVDLGEKLHVRGRGLDTRLAGQLQFTTPLGRPTVHGIVRAMDGTYAGYGQKLEIERGLLVFSGPPENPSLDILALRPNLDIKAGVAVVGTLVNPRVRLYSDPELSETDKLSWLVLGRPSDGLGRADTALLQRAAVALLAGEGEAPTDSFLRTIGLDEFSFRQGDGEVRETVITLGKQLSRRWYLGYERSVNATSGTWQLIYRIAQRLTVRAQTGNDNSLDVIWVWRRGESAR